MQTVQFSGLTCEACAKLITKRLSRLPGVTSVITKDPGGVFEIESSIPLTGEIINHALAGSAYSLVSIK